MTNQIIVNELSENVKQLVRANAVKDDRHRLALYAGWLDDHG
jgi:hypothetical protein